MKRNLVFFSFLLVFGLLGAAGTALAQSTVFGVSSSIDQVRFEGIKEATGQVVLTSSSDGFIVGSAIVGSQSKLTITYPVNLAVAVGNTNVSCNTNGGSACAAATAFSVTGAKGQPVVVITFLAASTEFKPGATITISGVRVNANAFGSSGTISATAAAVVPAAASSTNAITFSTGTSVPVANVHPAATDVTLTVGPGAILSCVSSTINAVVPAFELTIKEKFAQGLSSTADENGLSGTGTASQGSNILVEFTGVPKGVTITESLITVTAPFSVTLDTSTAAAQTGAVANDTLDFVFDVAATDTTAVETLVLDFNVSAPATLANGLAPNAITATVSLTSLPTAAATPPVPDFIGIEGSATAVSISDCVTNLLFPWIVVDAPGGTFDTGIALANTTKDVFISGGAVPQSGSCTLTGFNFGTGAAVPFTSPLGPITAGETGAFVLSSDAALAGFRGYVIAVCQFQDAHAFAFITQQNMTPNGTSQGYLALVIPSPNLQPRTAIGNKGRGESLSH